MALVAEAATLPERVHLNGPTPRERGQPLRLVQRLGVLPGHLEHDLASLAVGARRDPRAVAARLERLAQLQSPAPRPARAARPARPRARARRCRSRPAGSWGCGAVGSYETPYGWCPAHERPASGAGPDQGLAPNPERSRAARTWLRNSVPIRRPFGYWSVRSQRQDATIASIRIRHSRSSS